MNLNLNSNSEYGMKCRMYINERNHCSSKGILSVVYSNYSVNALYRRSESFHNLFNSDLHWCKCNSQRNTVVWLYCSTMLYIYQQDWRYYDILEKKNQVWSTYVRFVYLGLVALNIYINRAAVIYHPPIREKVQFMRYFEVSSSLLEILI